MSLLDEAMESCTRLNQVTADDGVGGYSSTWADGDKFLAAFAFSSSLEAKTAQKAGVTSLYTITTRRAFTLMFHDVIRRERDGKIFRITSDGDDQYTPVSAGLDMRNVSAEEWTIPQ